MPDLHGTDAEKTVWQLLTANGREEQPEHRFSSGLCVPQEAQTATDTMNTGSVKLISTLLAGPRRAAAAGRSDGVTYEEGQDRGVRRGGQGGGHNNAGKWRETKGRGDGG